MTQIDPHWTAYFSALLTPVVAVFGCIVTWRQYRIAQNKLKLDLFEKRFAVYNTARNMLGEIMIKGKLTDEGLYKYSAGIREAKWLMNDDVANYLSEELWDHAVDLMSYEAELEDKPIGEQRTTLVNKRGDLKKWFLLQPQVLDAKVEKFLRLSH